MVEPAQVRLQPEPQDGYEWTIRQERQHLLRKNLFKKQLSKHAIGAYTELYREVGQSFVAIRPEPQTMRSRDDDDDQVKESIRLATRDDADTAPELHHLQQENARLTAQLADLERAACEERKMNQQLTERLQSSEADLRTAYHQAERLRRMKSIFSARAKRYATRQLMLEKAVSIASSALHSCEGFADVPLE